MRGDNETRCILFYGKHESLALESDRFVASLAQQIVA